MERKQKTILLVESNLAEVDLARMACASCAEPLQLIVVEDHTQALEWFAARKSKKLPLPGLILLDLKLPKLLGLAVLRHLRMDAAIRDLPVIVYSAFHEPADVVLSYQVGANSFVNKPADLASFITLLDELSAYWLQPRQRSFDLGRS
ncbi:MAG: response regulator [Gallionellaceae bacterium]|jgi:two-component system response regulator